jgi:2-phosphosulfolactate phosphatase
MRVEVRFTIPEVESVELPGTVAVVVDVLRATSTLTTALARGAKAIYPSPSTEDALRLAQSLGREDTLLCGERKGLMIEGYDLGNSPQEFTPEVVEGKRLIMNTTNGTRALVAVQSADVVFAAAFLNLRAMADELMERDPERLLILCAGREDVFALEDAVCAGMLLSLLGNRGLSLDADDSARASLALASAHSVAESFLASTAAGKALLDLGLSEDLQWCAQTDPVGVVPVLRERALVPLRSSGD